MSRQYVSADFHPQRSDKKSRRSCESCRLTNQFQRDLDQFYPTSIKSAFHTEGCQGGAWRAITAKKWPHSRERSAARNASLGTQRYSHYQGQLAVCLSTLGVELHVTVSVCLFRYRPSRSRVMCGIDRNLWIRAARGAPNRNRDTCTP